MASDGYMKSKESVRRTFPGFPRQRPEESWEFPLDHPDWVYQAHNSESGRVFIFGTGPSLAEQRPLLHKMQNEHTWTVNRMRHFKPPFIPTYHGITEPGPIGGWGSYILKLYDFPEATNRIAISWWPLDVPDWKWVSKAPDDVQVRWEGWFGLGDELPPIPTAWASPLTFGQLACWLGYTELYYVGIDTTQQGQAWDPEHGRTREPRAIRSILECADRARIQIEKSGRKIYDCTPGGRLNEAGVLPYRDLAEVLND